METRIYEAPTDLGAIPVAKPKVLQNTLTPETEVVIINRGRDPLEDLFDGQPWVIPAGLSRMPYAAALHFKARKVVPGSRNPETGKQQSFIAILGTLNGHVIDPPDRCRPLDEVEQEKADESEEAIDRSQLSSPAARRAKKIKTSEVMAKLANQGVDMEAVEEQAFDPEALKATPAEQNAWHQDAKAREAERDLGREPAGGRRRS